MVSFSALFLASTAIAAVSAIPTSLKARTGTPSSTGTSGGFYYSFWTDGGADVIYTNGAGGEYHVAWDGNGDFTAGKGWNPGSSNPITYSGTFGPGGNAYLSIYGWFTNPLVEYYITENWDAYNPGTGGTHKGTVTSDGSVYDIYLSTRVNEPSIQGTTTFNQYINVRQSKRTGGTVTVANHINAWKALGLPVGTFNYQIVSTEGFDSSGVADITVA
ncbi:hypothetical protein FRB96_007098 [Tulasnella sp. 330]|nr:hypothetical protein FRB96_007098 [Tulasnella sp. 330]KAG8880046.1 hypothetical protein FRB97_001197 [Tulasnella sp. 331]KAG8887186.1 hypothetical protein FRB98_000396 [Tulasnella sp. 332]